MELKKLYTAVGRLEREANGCGHSCPVIVLGGERYMVDMQEMVVWTALNWRISKWDDISCQCDRLASSLGGCVARPWDACVNRLLIRGLLVSGCGETEFDALYDLLSSLGVIPTNGSAFVRGVSAAKLVLSRRITMKQATPRGCWKQPGAKTKNIMRTVTPQIRPNVCGVAPRWLRI